MFGVNHGIWLQWKNADGSSETRWFPAIHQAEEHADFVQQQGATEICAKLPEVEKRHTTVTETLFERRNANV